MDNSKNNNSSSQKYSIDNNMDNIKATGSIILCKGKVLILKEKKYKDAWVQPGGKKEGNETPEETCKRETFEETGIDVDKCIKKGFVDIKSFRTYIYEIKHKPNVDISKDDTILEYKWMNIGDESFKLHFRLKTALSNAYNKYITINDVENQECMIVSSDDEEEEEEEEEIKVEPPIKNISVNTNMKVITLEEEYDILGLSKLLCSDVIDPEWKARMVKYRKHSKNGKVKVNYTINPIGRLTIKIAGEKEETCTTQSCMKCIAKSVLCGKIYNDLDVVNAHPEMLLQTWTKLGYKCKMMKYYNENRDDIFKMCKDKYNISRDDVKSEINKIYYGGKLKISEPSIFKDVEKEIQINRKLFLSRDEMVKYRHHAIEEKGEDYYNLDGTALSYYAQTCECKILLCMYRWLKGKDYEIGALIHDGLHLKLKGDENIDDLCKYLSIFIQQQTGFDLKLKIKPFQEVPEIDNIITIETDKEGGDYITEFIKDDYVVSNERIFMRINDVWTSNDKQIKRGLIKTISELDIRMITYKTMKGENGFEKVPEINPYSRMNKGCNNLIPFVNPTEDDDFIDKLWSSNIGKLCFKNGYWDFKKACLKPYDNEVHTTIKINRDFKPATASDVQDVYDRILLPIFNNDHELMNVWLNYIARGLAGHVEDKNWGVGIGERDCGKGVLSGGLESCFGEYVRATNSENFLYKAGQQDSAKALSWLVPFEFKRLLLTNEITKDAENKYRINGNVLKKLSSGGDKIEARVNHKDEINFKIQSRVCMFCNDLPPIEPSDAKETSYMFKYPSKFVEKDDQRLSKPILRQKYHLNEHEEPVYEFNEIKMVRKLDPKLENQDKDYYLGSNKDLLDYIEVELTNETLEDKNVIGIFTKKDPIMINICNFYKKDDDIKVWFKQHNIMNAFIYILFNAYGKKLDLPQSMKDEQEDFKEEETDESKFFGLFNFQDDAGYSKIKNDWISISQINYLLKKASIVASSQKYKNWLHKKGCVKAKRTDGNGNRVNAWINIQVNEGKAEELGCEID